MQTLVVYIHDILPREFVSSAFSGVVVGYKYLRMSEEEVEGSVWSCVEVKPYVLVTEYPTSLSLVLLKELRNPLTETESCISVC